MNFIQKTTLLVVVLVVCVTSVFSQKDDYDVQNIPEELLDGANAIRRYRSIHYTVRSASDISLEYRDAVTLLNPSASELATVVGAYSSQNQINRLEVTVYAADGSVIKRYKKKDFEDRANFDGSMAQDYRLLVLEVPTSNYPITIEQVSQEKYKGLLSFMAFVPQSSSSMAVEYDEYILTTPPDYGYRVRTENGDPVETTLPDGSRRWSFKNLPVIQREPFDPGLENLAPFVHFAPNKITYDGWNGDISTWENLGKWSLGLLEGRQELSPATTKKIRELVADATTTEEKVCRVYEYMQNRTRYVSIQLGIGGFQPFPAKEVDETGYGDCKALSNYTQALLTAAGVPSLYAIIGAGDRKKNRILDFSSFGQDNHVIVCVPNNGDTLWLECTNQHQPCGFQGGFTANRTAVLVTPEGGRVVPTERFDATRNRTEAQHVVRLRPDGTATGTTQLRAYGLAFDDYDNLLRLTGKESADWVAQNYPLTGASPKLGRVEVTHGTEVALHWDATFELPRAGAVQGNRLLVNACPLAYTPIANSGTARQHPVVVSEGYTRVTQFDFLLPEGYKVEYLPTEKTLETPFGTCKIQVNAAADKVTITRTFVLREGTYAPTQWTDFLQFTKQASPAGVEKMVLVRG
jgi:Domain of Unknown Function with PDB structure (DUF3857)/Domain of Unknown Function with PDB structure (DUF3858)